MKLSCKDPHRERPRGERVTGEPTGTGSWTPRQPPESLWPPFPDSLRLDDMRHECGRGVLGSCSVSLADEQVASNELPSRLNRRDSAQGGPDPESLEQAASRGGPRGTEHRNAGQLPRAVHAARVAGLNSKAAAHRTVRRPPCISRIRN